jgi:DNA polymerase III delta prime subunit
VYYQSLLSPPSIISDGIATLRIIPLDGKSSISIDQVHLLQQELSLQVSTSEKRTIIIEPAHALTLPAQQALLKTLEEPPRHTQIILVTDTPHMLLPTILSRCAQSSVLRFQFSEKITEIPKSYGEAIKLSDSYSAKREDAIRYIQAIINSSIQSQIKKAALQCLTRLRQNVNVKLALDNFFFSVLHSR